MAHIKYKHIRLNTYKDQMFKTFPTSTHHRQILGSVSLSVACQGGTDTCSQTRWD